MKYASRDAEQDAGYTNIGLKGEARSIHRLVSMMGNHLKRCLEWYFLGSASNDCMGITLRWVALLGSASGDSIAITLRWVAFALLLSFNEMFP